MKEAFLAWSQVLLLWLALAPAPPAASPAAADWPQWRGPNRDGRVQGFNAPRAWPKTLREQWKVTVGVGHSSPLLVGDRLYVFARSGEEETLMALDANSGQELWRSSQRVAYEMNSAARDHGKGPKSTPVFSDNRVCTLGISGHLSCHDARTGKAHLAERFFGPVSHHLAALRDGDVAGRREQSADRARRRPRQGRAHGLRRRDRQGRVGLRAGRPGLLLARRSHPGGRAAGGDLHAERAGRRGGRDREAPLETPGPKPRTTPTP